MLKTILDHFQAATEGYLDAQEMEKDDPKRIFVSGKYAAMKALVADIRLLPESRTTSKPSPQPVKQPRTLMGGLLGSRAKLIAEDVMDSLEAEGGGGQ